MKYRHLLAKAAVEPKSPRHEATLIGHSERVLDAAEVFADLLFPDMEQLLSNATLARWITITAPDNSDQQPKPRTRKPRRKEAES